MGDRATAGPAARFPAEFADIYRAELGAATMFGLPIGDLSREDLLATVGYMLAQLRVARREYLGGNYFRDEHLQATRDYSAIQAPGLE